MAKKSRKKPPKLTDEDLAEHFKPKEKAQQPSELLLPQTSKGAETHQKISDQELFLRYIDDYNPNFEEILQKDDLDRPKKLPSVSRLSQSGRKSSSKEKRVYSVDLHGKTLEQAKSQIRRVFQDFIHEGGKRNKTTVRVITGKGKNSGPDGGVLGAAIYAFVSHEFKNHIEMLDSSPEETIIGEGLPLRGHFDFIFLF